MVTCKTIKNNYFYTKSLIKSLTNALSSQFVPRKQTSNKRNQAIPLQKDGYIFCTVVTTENVIINNKKIKQHNSEIWIFDANNLAQGAICKLAHENMKFAFTIHSVWVKEANEVSEPDYVIPMKSDYDFMINKITNQALKKEVQIIFDE